jgi:hypothetical protein
VLRGLFLSIIFALTHKHSQQEVSTMWNEPSIERLSKIPKLYETENVRLQDKLKSISINGIEIDCEIEEAWKVRRAVEINKIRIANVWPRETAPPQEEKKSDLILKVQAGHFPHFQDLFAEVTSPYSDYFGMDPNPIWKKARERQSK